LHDLSLQNFVALAASIWWRALVTPLATTTGLRLRDHLPAPANIVVHGSILRLTR
jgi:hypothetical protein